MYVCMYIYIYIYVYIERERERDIYTHMYPHANNLLEGDLAVAVVKEVEEGLGLMDVIIY